MWEEGREFEDVQVVGIDLLHACMVNCVTEVASYLAVHEFEINPLKGDLQETPLTRLHILHRKLSSKFWTCTCISYNQLCNKMWYTQYEIIKRFSGLRKPQCKLLHLVDTATSTITLGTLCLQWSVVMVASCWMLLMAYYLMLHWLMPSVTSQFGIFLITWYFSRSRSQTCFDNFLSLCCCLFRNLYWYHINAHLCNTHTVPGLMLCCLAAARSMLSLTQ